MAKWIGRIVLAAAGLALLYYAGRFVLAHWRAVAFWTYLLVAALVALANLIQTTRLLKGSASDEHRFAAHMLRLSRAMTNRQSVLDRFQLAVTIVVTPIYMALSWPGAIAAYVVLIRRALTPALRGNLIAIGARQLLAATDIYVSAGVLLLLLCVAPVDFWFGLSDYGRDFVIALLIATGARHVTYTIGMSIGQKLRRGIGNPYRQFVLLAASDFLILVLAYSILMGVFAGSRIDWSRLQLVALHMVNPSEWRDLVDLQGFLSLDWFSNVSSVLFSGALLSSIIRYKEFQPDDEDYIAMAGAHLATARFGSALACIDRVKEQNSRAYLQRGVALLGVNEIKRSADAIRHAFGLQKPEMKDPAEIERTVLMNMFVCSSIHPIPKAVVLDLFGRIQDAQLRSGQVLLVIESLLFSGRMSSRELLDVFESKELCETYSLAYAFVLLVDGRRDSAQPIVEALVPASPFQIVFRSMLLMMIAVADPTTDGHADQAALRQWLSDELPKIRPVLDELNDDADRVIASALLMQLAALAASLEQEREQELLFLSGELLNRVDDDQTKSGAQLVRDSTYREHRRSFKKLYGQ